MGCFWNSIPKKHTSELDASEADCEEEERYEKISKAHRFVAFVSAAYESIGENNLTRLDGLPRG